MIFSDVPSSGLIFQTCTRCQLFFKFWCELFPQIIIIVFFFENLETAKLASPFTQELFGEVPHLLLNTDYVVTWNPQSTHFRSREWRGSLDQTVLIGATDVGEVLDKQSGHPWERALRTGPKVQRGDEETSKCKHQDLTEGRPWLSLAQIIIDWCTLFPMTTFSRLSVAECHGTSRVFYCHLCLSQPRGQSKVHMPPGKKWLDGLFLASFSLSVRDLFIRNVKEPPREWWNVEKLVQSISVIWIVPVTLVPLPKSPFGKMVFIPRFWICLSSLLLFDIA